MKGLIFDGVGAKLINNLEVKDPGPDEVLIKVEACGLCHSDLGAINGTLPCPAPTVLGHEPAGVVAAIGSKVTLLKPGDHVVISTLDNCGHCASCQAGYPTHCRGTLGNPTTPFSMDGTPVYNFARSSGFCEYTVVKQHQAVAISTEIPFTSACLMACGVVTGTGAVFNRARVRPGETATVFGVGGVGLNVLQALQIVGATRIIAVDICEDKEALAREFGATDFINPNTIDSGDVDKEIRRIIESTNSSKTGIFGAGGVDWSFECTGNMTILDAAVQCLDWGGSCIMIGIPPNDTRYPLPVQHMTMVDRAVMGCRYGSTRPQQDIPRLVTMYNQGKLKLDELVSQQYDIQDYEQAFKDLHEGRLARGVFTF